MKAGDYVTYFDAYGNSHNVIVSHVHPDGRVNVVYFDKGENRISPMGIPVGKTDGYADYCLPYEPKVEEKKAKPAGLSSKTK